MEIFSQIMAARRDPDRSEDREAIADIAGTACARCMASGFIVVITLDCIAGTANAIAKQTFPWYTTISLIFLAFREATYLLWNIVVIMLDETPKEWTEELVAREITRSTLLARFFRKTIERELKPT